MTVALHTPDALQINVYILGKAFLQFSRSLNLKLPLVDPALYIHRFAARLDLGDKLTAVITTALRIVTRLKKDWITTGRRPDGICAVSILIASRCHGFHKSQGEIAKLFRISGDTLMRRLDDFRATPAAQMTVEQFHLQDLDYEYDPPAYIRSKVGEAGDDGVDLALSLEEIGEENKYEDILVDGLKAKRCQIGGVEVDVLIPGQKKQRYYIYRTHNWNNLLTLIYSNHFCRISSCPLCRKLTACTVNRTLARKALYDNIYTEISEATEGEAAADALRLEADEVNTSVEFGGWGTSAKRRLVEKRGELRFVPGQSQSQSQSTVSRARAAGPGSGHTLGADDSGGGVGGATTSAVSDADGVLDIDVDGYILDQDEQKKR